MAKNKGRKSGWEAEAERNRNKEIMEVSTVL